MAAAVGLDLIDVASVADSIRAHGDRYLNRIYTEGERDECRLDPRKLAMRFAVKEATMKLLEGESLPWRAIEVCSGAGHGPRLVLHSPASEMALQRGVRRLSVSFSSTQATATAIVIGETTA